VLTAARHELLSWDLPQRFGVPAPDLQPVVQQLGAMRADTATRDAAREAREAAKKADAELPSLRWGEHSTTQLMNLCQVADENQLPEVWKAMAKAGAKQDRFTIQSHLRSHAGHADSRSTQAPICSPDLAKDMGALTFEALSSDDLKGGLSIFAVCHPDQDSASRASELAGHFDLQMNGVSGMSLAESIALKAAQQLKLPTKLLQVRLILTAYHTLLEVLMGPEHPLVVQYGLFLHRVGAMEYTLDELLDGKLTNCAGVLRFVQLKMYIWLKQQLRSEAAIPPPAFTAILDKMEEWDWTPVSLPAAYLQTPARPPTGSTPSASTSTGSGAAMAANPADTTKRGYYKAPVAQLDTTALKIRPSFKVNEHITAHGQPPTNDAGGLMCLSFHIRGGCRHECERGPSSGAKNDHKRHSAGETQHLVAYLNQAGPTTALGGGL
jgi:hypothetical protein